MEPQNMQPQAKNKKLLYIIGVIGVLLLGSFIISFIVSRSISSGTGVNMNYNTDGTQTYSNNEGQVTVGNNAGMPSSWPSDAPANYQGAKILFSGNSNPQTGKTGSVVSYTVQGATVQAVAGYYQSEFTAKGWTIEGNTNLGSQAIIGATKSGRTFGVSIVDSGNGSISVTAGLELQ